MKRLLFRSAEAGSGAYLRQVRELASALRGGEVVAFPTDTIWGVAALAEDAAAIHKIFELKGREPSKSLPVFAGSAGQAREWLEEFPPALERLAARFWPGPLTLVGRPRAGRLEPALAADGTVGVRVPAVALIRSLMAELGVPLACTSANRSGEPPLPDAEAVASTLGHGLAVIADNDEPSGGLASTVVAWREGRLEVLRQGAIDEATIAETTR